MNNQFRAVSETELRSILGDQCSPMGDKRGYIIGPDITGRICHCATCFSMGHALRTAAEMNAKAQNDRPT